MCVTLGYLFILARAIIEKVTLTALQGAVDCGIIKVYSIGTQNNIVVNIHKNAKEKR